MALKDMLKALEEEGQQQLKEITETARKQARDIIEAAEQQAAGIKDQYVERMNKVIAGEKTKLMSDATVYVKREVSRAKEEVIGSAFNTTSDNLRNTRTAKDYPETFERLAREAVSQTEGPVVAHVDSRDAKLADSVLKKIGADYTLKPDLKTAGGLNITVDNGRIVIENTLEVRIDRARRFLKSEVVAILY